MGDYGARIKQARESLGLTQEELGNAIGVTGVTIMRYEKNQREPTQQKLLAIANALHTSITTLMGIEEDTSVSDFHEVIDWLEVAGFSIEKSNEYDVWSVFDSDGNEVGLYNEYDLISIFKKIIEDGDTLKHDFIIQKIKLLFRK